VPADSPSLHAVYDAFQRNLEKIITVLLESRSKVVLCTVAVNLADWGPSGRSALPENSPAAKLLGEGRRLLEGGDYPRAVASLEEATAGAPENAEIAFYLGKALQQSGRAADARKALETARDLDMHRFRADSRINDIIRETAAKFSDRGVVLVDADQLLAEDSLPDRRYFTEHVHMTFEGMNNLATLVAGLFPRLVPSLGLPHPSAHLQDNDLRRRIFFTPFDEVLLASVAREVGATQVFRDRPGADETAAYLRAREDKLRADNPLDTVQLQREYESSLRVRGPDARTDASLADYLSRMGETAAAAEAGRRVLLRQPNYFEGLRFQADEAKKRGDNNAAERLYRQAISIYRLIPDAWKNLGDLSRAKGDSRCAQECYGKAVRYDAGNVPAALALAEMEANTGDRATARDTLDTARSNNPGSAQIATALGRLCAAEGDKTSARKFYEEALAADPLLSPRELMRFATESLSAPETKEIFAAFEGRFGVESDLYNNFAWLLATSPVETVRDPASALRLSREAVRLSETPNAYYLGTLAAAEAAGGDFSAALETLARARKTSTDPVFLDSAERMESAFRSRLNYFDAE
jgi:tetratricopeptide (TPR) repeat protein